MNTYTILDLETSGGNSKYAEIIEISAIKIHMGNIIDSFSYLVKPENPIDPCSSAINGITEDMVKDAPAIEEVLPKFLSFIGNDCLVGYNIKSFDLPILRRVIKNSIRRSIDNDCVDVLLLARKCMPDLKDHKLSTVAEYLEISTEGAHRALKDCYITLDCYKKILKMPNCECEKTDKKNVRNKSTAISDVLPTRTCFDVSHPLYKKSCVFTGDLQYLSRREAMQLVVDVGGILNSSVKINTDFLIAGHVKTKDGSVGNMSTKQFNAYTLQRKGYGIKIITEDEFLDMFRNTQNNKITSLFNDKPYIRFENDDDRNIFLKKYGLLSQNPRKKKIFFYKGKDYSSPVICEIVGYVQEYSSSATIAIDYGCGIDFILSDYLKQMQQYTFSVNDMEDSK